MDESKNNKGCCCVCRSDGWGLLNDNQRCCNCRTMTELLESSSGLMLNMGAACWVVGFNRRLWWWRLGPLLQIDPLQGEGKVREAGEGGTRA